MFSPEWLNQLSKVSMSLLIAICIASGITLFASDQLAATLGVADFRNAYRTYLGPIFIVSAAWVVGRAIAAAARDIGARLERSRRFATRRDVLDNLSPFEQEVLAAFILRRESVVYLPLDDRRLQNLLAHKIVYSSRGIVTFESGIPYSLNVWARKLLTKQPELLGAQSGESCVTTPLRDEYSERF